jgi:triacylglycerol lipase
MKKLTLLLLITAFCSCQKKEVVTTQSDQEEAVTIEKQTPLPTARTPTTSTQLLQNTYDGAPIILVHGFLGFGRDEVSANFKSWGGKTDLQEVLKARGYTTFTASVGPVSSNYDRAIELYYQIKGGCVDYGKFHSDKFKHLQKPNKCYPGFYPQWDAQHPVHLIGHSMGGQTIRLLNALLEKGVDLEASEAQHASIFDGYKKGWVKSITCIATPNKGATLANIVTDLRPFIKNDLAAVAALVGTNSSTDVIYDFDLEQWGLKRLAGESYATYFDRVYQSAIWTNNKDFSTWDLKPEGALELNNFTGNSPNTYFFSISTRATNTGRTTSWEYPSWAMSPILMPFAYPKSPPFRRGIGNYTQSGAGLVTVDKSWWQNDGVVNTVSMTGPEGSTNVTYTGQDVVKGTWYNKPVFNGYDHFAIVGRLWQNIDLKPLYLEQAALITSLPR